MNRDKLKLQPEPKEHPPVFLAGGEHSDALLDSNLWGHMHDPETGDPTYRLYNCQWTGRPIIEHLATGNVWSPSWRSLVSEAESHGIKAQSGSHTPSAGLEGK